jgi:hypothetical protein
VIGVPLGIIAAILLFLRKKTGVRSQDSDLARGYSEFSAF